MVDIPFATVDELKARWPDFPAGGESYAEVHLEDASQFILDVCPSATEVSAGTRRRVVCAVVRRAMQASAAGQVGMSQMSETAGPFSASWTASNPNGDYYLTKQELKALGGGGRPKAFSIPAGDVGWCPSHRLWCSLAFGATYCSCGADLTLDEPLWEA
jgi:hypothetical protein